MINDTLHNFSIYASAQKHFGIVQEYLSTTDITNVSIGRHLINKDCYAIVSEYKPKKLIECFLECHRKYIDIQILLKGTECIGFCPIGKCTPVGTFDVEKDFQKLEGPFDLLTLHEGSFAIFFPHDCHMPQVRSGEEVVNVKKMVIKVAV